MTSVRVVCTMDCGQVEVALNDIKLYVSADPDLSYYTFTCSKKECHAFCRRPASVATIDGLTAAGLKPIPYTPPTEPDPHDGPPLVMDDRDDLLDLILAINAHGVLDHEPTYGEAANG